ncbi:MAG: flagellar brake domain-containing protein [Candidatus Anammoxibacter sp.]
MTEVSITKSRKAGATLSIGIGTEMQIEITDVSARFKSELLGMDVNHYIIAKMPMIVDDGFEERCSASNRPSVTCRYLYEGTVFGFQSHLLNITLQHTRLLFIEYPDRVEEQSVREHERVSCMLPCKIKAESLVLDGTVLDLSLSGSLVSVRYEKKGTDDLIETLYKSHTVDFLLQLPGEPKAFLIPAIRKVVRRDDTMLNIGLQFCNIGNEVERKISHFMDAAKAIQPM